MSERIKNFRDLIIWQKSMGLVEKVYAITNGFPRDEQYGLTTQLRRAVISVPSNIAEGFRRRHPKEYKQFLAIALGSLGEIETQFEIARRLGYFADNLCADCLVEVETLCKMIQSLSNKIKSSHLLTAHD